MSEDFGTDDDDTVFLAAATQVEASQHGGGFEPSPRPTKRRRVRRHGPSQLDGASSVGLDWSDTDDEYHSPPKRSTYLQSTAASPSDGDVQEAEPGSDAPDDEYYLPGELHGGEDNAAKNSRFRIHNPEHGGRFPDMIVSQTQHGLDEDLTKFRGAVWKRPRAQPLPNVAGVANPNGFGKTAARAVNGIGSYFRAVGRETSSDDAILAAQLQEQENAAIGVEMNGRNGGEYTTNSLSLAAPHHELATQLEDLPSDAFSSSSPEKSPRKNVIELSSQLGNSQTQGRALRAPQNGLKQMTIFGQPATQGLTTSQAASKRHAWPLASRDEAPTHHKLDENEMKTWVYPTNLGAVRDYQYNIVSRSLFHNTLVALPTGLGKTFIAAAVMLNYYRWTKEAQIVFMAPTKPLIAQQMEACYGIVGIQRRDTVLMTGETTPAIRANEWLEKRVFFMTPQTVINDLKTGICDPKKLVLLVVDEAHKATGGYAYTEVIAFMRRFNSSFRVLALTATPGSTVEAVQSVIDNLGIARVELRTEHSLDIREYTHEKHTETEVFDFSDEQERIMTMFSKALRPTLEKLTSQNAYWSKDPMALTAYGLTTARQKWAQSDAGRKAPQPVKGMINMVFIVLAGLAHTIGLLKFHGIGPFYSGVLAFQRGVESGEQRGKTASGIAHSDGFTKMMSTIRTWTNDPEFVGHPKLEYLREVVLNHFLDAGEGRQGSDVPPSATRVMVFASYRDSTEDICRVLKRNEPMIRPHVFVGQAASKGQEGMDQKKQNAVIQDFKSGKYNTLIATSIGEEGLDIGTVDLIVCYDASSSPIRMLQRIGRTGRKRVGKVVLLLMKGKEEKDYEKAQDNYAWIQKTIADPNKYAYRDDQSPRILPKEVKPLVDKRPVDIPVENSQPIDLNEKGRRARGKAKTKRPPKKFHMPDNVRTGFVNASRLDSDSDGTARRGSAPKKTAFKRPESPAFPRIRSPTPEPEAAPLPHLPDVLLNDQQLSNLQQQYAQAADADAEGVVQAPDHTRFPMKLRNLGPTRVIRHGRRARLVEKTMQSIHDVNVEKLHHLDELHHISDIEDAGSAQHRLVSPEEDLSSKAAVISRQSVPTAAPMDKHHGQTRKTSTADVVSCAEDPVRDGKHSHRPRASRASSVKKLRGRPRKIPTPEAVSDGDDPVLDQVHPPQPALPQAALAKKPRGRPKKKQPLQRAVSYGSAAGEGAESSPEPTPADMRIATQGIDLGSRDTSGEEEEEEADSEDNAFIAKSSDPIEMVSDPLGLTSSSLPGTPIKKRGRLKNKTHRRVSLESVQEVDESEVEVNTSSETEAGLVQKADRFRKRRVVRDSDDEEDD